jgi:hypothetical protein
MRERDVVSCLSPSGHPAAHRSKRGATALILLSAAVLVGALWPGVAWAIPFELKKTTVFKNLDSGANIPAAEATTNNTFRNCIVQQGCLGIDGLIFMFDNANPPMIVDANANLPNKIEFRFALTQAEANEINTMKGFGILRLDAARDIGKRCAETDPADATKCKSFNQANAMENLKLTDNEGKGFSDLLFEDLQSAKSCPAGENAQMGGNGNVINMNCGPNFHTDVRDLASSVRIPQDILKQMTQDMELVFALEPNKQGGAASRIGRLKLFEATFNFQAVPEPSGLLLIGLGLAGLAGVRAARGRTHRLRADNNPTRRAS